MSKSVLAALFLSAGVVGASVWSGPLIDPRSDENAEPERAFTLMVDGQEVALQPGIEVHLEGKFENPTVKLELGATRHFRYGGISFEYPASFVWEADVSNPSFRMWTMDGASVSLMVFRTSFGFSAEEFVDSLADEFDSFESMPISQELGKLKLQGETVTTEVAQSVLTYDVFEVPSEVGSTLLILMDATDDGVHTEEYRGVMRGLWSSLRLVGEIDAERMRELEAEIADVQGQIEVFEVTYTDDQPILKDLRDRLARLEAELAALRGGSER